MVIRALLGMYQLEDGSGGRRKNTQHATCSCRKKEDWACKCPWRGYCKVKQWMNTEHIAVSFDECELADEFIQLSAMKEVWGQEGGVYRASGLVVAEIKSGSRSFVAGLGPLNTSHYRHHSASPRHAQHVPTLHGRCNQ